MAQSGDPCPRCEGKIQVVKTFVVGTDRIRYLGCRGCGYRPEDNCQRVPIQYAPARITRVIATSSTPQS